MEPFTEVRFDLFLELFMRFGVEILPVFRGRAQAGWRTLLGVVCCRGACRGDSTSRRGAGGGLLRLQDGELGREGRIVPKGVAAAEVFKGRLISEALSKILEC